MHNQILVLNFKLKCFQFLSFIDEVDVKLCGVLVEGDQEALEYSYNIVKRGVPLVVVNDSGKMADAVSISFRSKESDEEKSGASSKDRQKKFIVH